MGVTDINCPAAGVGTAVTVTTTAETVAATSAPCNVDNLATNVQLEASLDISVGAAGATVTIKLERGTAAGGTPITKGGTWGPFAVSASTRYNFTVQGVDTPGQSAGQQYVATVTVGSASGNSTVNVAVLSAIVAPNT
jgi:hypothetical protein